MWRGLNPAGFEYKQPAAGERQFGFVNAYASANDFEDRASTFQWLMARPEQLCEIAKGDEIVRAKVNLLWSRIASVVGDDFLRKRAACVTWIEPIKPPVIGAHGPEAAVPMIVQQHERPTPWWIRDPGASTTQWLSPPIRPSTIGRPAQ